MKDELKSENIIIENEINNLISQGQRVDMCPKIWMIGEKLSIDKLAQFMTLILQAISEHGPKLVVDGNNDVSIFVTIFRT